MTILIMSLAVSCSHLSQLSSLFKKETEEFRGSGNTPLSAISLHETGVVLDIYEIQVPYDRRELLAQFWEDVDENEIPSEIRNELNKYGLRQGILSSKIPASLARLLGSEDFAPQRPFEKVTTIENINAKKPLELCKTVTMTKNQPLAFPTCPTITKLPILTVVDGYPTGQDYHNARGFILITTEELPDGSVKLKTVPEIHFGDEAGKITSNGGVYTRQVTKSKLSFDQLAVETKLLLGQWVVIGPDLRKNGGFGRDILTQGNSTVPEQIIIAIRLNQTKKDGTHDRNGLALTGVKPSEHDSETIRPTFDEIEDAPSTASVE
jgi:hypothetical protein